MGAGAVILMTRPRPLATLSFTRGYIPQPRWGRRAERDRDGTIRGQTNWETVRLLAPEGSRNVATGEAAAAKPADAQPVEPDPSSFFRAPEGRRTHLCPAQGKIRGPSSLLDYGELCRNESGTDHWRMSLPSVLFSEYKFLVECFEEI